MIKHDSNEEEMVWMGLKFPKLGFLSNLLNLEPRSRHNVTSSHRNVGEEPMPCCDVRVPKSWCGESGPGQRCDVQGVCVMTWPIVLPQYCSDVAKWGLHVATALAFGLFKN